MAELAGADEVVAVGQRRARRRLRVPLRRVVDDLGRHELRARNDVHHPAPSGTSRGSPASDPPAAPTSRTRASRPNSSSVIRLNSCDGMRKSGVPSHRTPCRTARSQSASLYIPPMPPWPRVRFDDASLATGKRSIICCPPRSGAVAARAPVERRERLAARERRRVGRHRDRLAGDVVVLPQPHAADDVRHEHDDEDQRDETTEDPQRDARRLPHERHSRERGSAHSAARSSARQARSCESHDDGMRIPLLPRLLRRVVRRRAARSVASRSPSSAATAMAGDVALARSARAACCSPR